MNPFDTSFDQHDHRGHTGAGRSARMSSKTRRRRILITVTGILAVALIIYTILADGPGFQTIPSTTVSNAVSSHVTEEVESRDPANTQPSVQEILPVDAVVYVTGAVAVPGLVTLPEGSRIGSAIEAAGGFAEDAAIAAVNLAEILADGMHIHIPTNEEFANGAWAASGGATGGTVAGISSSAPPTPARVNINTADSATLQTLTGIGPATAQKIIDYRNAHGGFRTIEEIRNVSGIGDKKFEAIANYITV